MDALGRYRELIEKILTEHARIPYSHWDLQKLTVFDRNSDNYLLVVLGREGIRRVHACMIHLAIINGKIWIQRDGTEYGIANELVDAGVPKDQIVLGFRSPEMRKYTEFAVA